MPTVTSLAAIGTSGPMLMEHSKYGLCFTMNLTDGRKAVFYGVNHLFATWFGDFSPFSNKNIIYKGYHGTLVVWKCLFRMMNWCTPRWFTPESVFMNGSKPLWGGRNILGQNCLNSSVCNCIALMFYSRKDNFVFYNSYMCALYLRWLEVSRVKVCDNTDGISISCLLFQDYIFYLEPEKLESGKGKCSYDPKVDTVSALISEFLGCIISVFLVSIVSVNKIPYKNTLHLKEPQNSKITQKVGGKIFFF